jgi:hypothetical protein
VLSCFQFTVSLPRECCGDNNALVTNPRQNYFGACEREQTSTLSVKMPPKFVPRQRKHKVIARQKAASARDAALDANTEEILPLEQQEHNQKKAALKEDLVRESQGKVTGKKKKRLDKYIVRLNRA